MTYIRQGITKVVGIESRGFFMGPPRYRDQLGVGFVPTETRELPIK
jgi:adenine/guanine phosphoribosyltransferase-like PRPP-binding protein